jgi:hypothetical protein
LVKDGEDFHDVSVVNEIDSEREAPRKDPASLEEDGRVSQRAVRCPFYRSVELEEELNTQARLLRLVPCRCLIGFSLRARLNVD